MSIYKLSHGIQPIANLLKSIYNKNIIIKYKNMEGSQPIVHLVTDNEVQGKAKELFEQMKTSTGKVPKWMRVMANCEDTLVGFSALFKSVMDDAPAPQELKWKVAYVVSEINKCEFCVGVTKTKLTSLGVDDEKLANLEDTPDEKEKVAIEYARATTEHAYSVSPELVDKMKNTFNDQEIVEITSVIGLFNYINRFNDALRILPDLK
jgi:uncharacterized peroxidase-related enzyme